MIAVRQYGCRPPLDWGDDCHDELFRQNRLWNALVEIDRADREGYRAIVGADTQIQPLETELTEAREHKAELTAERKALRAKARAKVATPGLDCEIANTATAIRELAATLKPLRAAARVRQKPLLDELALTHKGMVKQARQQSGLYWGNYNAVVEAYNRARSKAMKEGADLRFHRFDGTGRFTVQVQKRTPDDEPGMAPDELFGAARPNLASLDPLPADAYNHPHRGDRGRKQWSVLTLRVTTHPDGAPRLLSIPVKLHRPLPNGRVKWATVHRRRVGTRFVWSATFTCSVADQEPQHSATAACGIDIGWRLRPNGDLRAALIIGSDGKTTEIRVDAHIIRALTYCEQIQSELDDGLNIAHAAIKTLDPTDAPEAIAERLARIRKAPKIGAGKLAMLAIVWREHDWQTEARDALEAWRAADKRRRDEMDNLRDKTLRRRREGYRIAVKSLVERYAVIGLEKFDLRQVAKLEQANGDENELPAPARRYRQLAGVSEFRDWLKTKAKSEGSELVEVDGPTTMTCRQCGTINRPADRAALHWQCTGCHAVWDQDINAAHNILDAVCGTAASAEIARVA